MSIDPSGTASFVRALLTNARELLADADLLLANGRCARAFALSVLAMEEAGKAAMVLAKEFDGIGLPGARLRDHQDKILAAAAMQLVLLGDPDDWEATAQELANGRSHAMKMSGMYVDFEDGELKTPEQITCEMAREACESAGQLIHTIVIQVGDLTPQSLAEARDWLETAGPQLDAHFEQVGVSATLVLLRQLAGVATVPPATSIPDSGGIPSAVD